jgi:hypothetical protein
MRLERAFAAMGMRAAEHCVFLPRLEPQRFLAAMGRCDIFLDSIGWSGCNSTLESLDHDLPMVTMAGPLMRGRHTVAILRRMDVIDTIAEEVDQYVSVAVRLANDLPLRAALKARIAAGKQSRLCRSGLRCGAGRISGPRGPAATSRGPQREVTIMILRIVPALAGILVWGCGVSAAGEDEYGKTHRSRHARAARVEAVPPQSASPGGRLVTHPAWTFACEGAYGPNRGPACDIPIWVYGSPCEVGIGWGRSRPCNGR